MPYTEKESVTEKEKIMYKEDKIEIFLRTLAKDMQCEILSKWDVTEYSIWIREAAKFTPRIQGSEILEWGPADKPGKQ